MRASSLSPDSYTVGFHGRPLQACALLIAVVAGMLRICPFHAYMLVSSSCLGVRTCLQAPPEDLCSYLHHVQRPLRPLGMLGVSAKTWAGEWKQPQVAVMQCWEASAQVLSNRTD